MIRVRVGGEPSLVPQERRCGSSAAGVNSGGPEPPFVLTRLNLVGRVGAAGGAAPSAWAGLGFVFRSAGLRRSAPASVPAAITAGTAAALNPDDKHPPNAPFTASLWDRLVSQTGGAALSLH